MDTSPGPDADVVERTLATVRRVVVPVVAGLVVLVAVLAADAAESGVAARSGATRVTATVLQTRADPGPVPVTWRDPGRGVRVADVRLGQAATAGRTVTLWLGPDGAPTVPRDRAAVLAAGVTRGAWVLGVGGLLVLLVDRVARRAALLRASDRLDREWRATELRWREDLAG
ncbi:hypothetical protein [Pseudonocardia sp. HH130630-07]|uniref:hypothetical protein n=1 Tax=Pseudonocardia sp. HH130630-07 TaxID=1690815 RepID=UPI000814E418|nr:hypothetical protein [Pseudonocardia sp. HH130630-07]ANY08640.1 hypothetical protein AFB00_22875 [Pseudonocardia sp. HH130630-07]